jgi:hypothetical protein
MKTIDWIVPVRLVALAAALLAAPATASAQGQARATINDLKFEDLPSPDISSGKGKSFKPKDWLEVEARVRIELAPKPESGFVDQVTAKWYVAVQNPDGKGFFLLTKDVNHINLPTDEEIYCSVYLSPTSIKRLTGTDRAGKSVVDRVGLEILRNGVKIGQISTKGDEGWWDSPSLARTDKFPLLDKNQTPFKILWWDRYAEIQDER